MQLAAMAKRETYCRTIPCGYYPIILALWVAFLEIDAVTQQRVAKFTHRCAGANRPFFEKLRLVSESLRIDHQADRSFVWPELYSNGAVKKNPHV